MKRFLLFTVLGFSLTASLEALAGYCLVTTESDSGSNGGSLRYKIETTYNHTGSGSNCTPPSSGSSAGDDDFFEQVVIFATSEAGYANNVNAIELNNPIEFQNSSKNIVIGNWAPDVVADTTSVAYDDYTANSAYVTAINAAGDYGRVLIDGKSNLSSGENPFTCDGSSNVYFRHLVVQTNALSKTDLFIDCLYDAGDNYVCYGDVVGTTDDLLDDPSAHCDNDQDGYVDDQDCDDEDASIYPGADEILDDGIDQDCDGSDQTSDTKDGEEEDNDGDGYTTDEGDCDDNDASVNPGATETCNDKDDDCDGQTDEDLTESTYYADNDGDGYGDESAAVTECAQPDDYVTTGGDCDDADSAVNPGEAELCDDGADNDCDGLSDDADDDCACDPTIYYPDSDADGYGDADSSLAVEACETPSGYIDNNEDCDDGDSAINPEATETCGDGVDNDCDGSADEGSTWYIDSDEDGYGSDSSTAQACDQPDGYTDNSGDCDDSNDSISPEATELCEDGTDNNCDDVIDGEDTITCQETEVPDEFDVMLEGGSGCSLNDGEDKTSQNVFIFNILVAISLVFLLRVRRRQTDF